MHTPRDIEIARVTETDLGSNRDQSLEGAGAFCTSEGSVKEEPTKVDSSPLLSTELAGGSIGVGVGSPSRSHGSSCHEAYTAPPSRTSLTRRDRTLLPHPPGEGIHLGSPPSRCVWP